MWVLKYRHEFRVGLCANSVAWVIDVDIVSSGLKENRASSNRMRLVSKRGDFERCHDGGAVLV